MVLQGTSVLQLTIIAGHGTNSSAQSELHETDAQCGKSSLGGARKQLGLLFRTNPEQSEPRRRKAKGRDFRNEESLTKLLHPGLPASTPPLDSGAEGQSARPASDWPHRPRVLCGHPTKRTTEDAAQTSSVARHRQSISTPSYVASLWSIDRFYTPGRGRIALRGRSLRQEGQEEGGD